MQVFIAISLILGDGIYNLIKIIAITVKEISNKSTKDTNLPVTAEALGKDIYSFESNLKIYPVNVLAIKSMVRHFCLLPISLKNKFEQW